MLTTSPNQVGLRSYSTCGTLFLLFVQQACLNIARKSIMSLVHLTDGWAIPQDKNSASNIEGSKTTEKLLQSSK